MTSQISLHAVDRVTAHLCAELRAAAVPHAHFGDVVLLKNVPAQFRGALMRQGARELVMVGGEQALRLDHVEGWLGEVRRVFHVADSAEIIKGLTFRRRFAFGGIADNQLSGREAIFAQEQGRKRGVGPLTAMVAQQLGLPVAPPTKAAECMPPPPGKVLPAALVDKLLADGRVETHEIWQLVHQARRVDRCTNGREALEAFRDKHGATFSQDARAALDEYLATGAALVDGTVPSAHEGLRALWQSTRTDWDLSVMDKPKREHTREEMLEKAGSIFLSTNEEGYRLANEVRDFFKKYPSTGGRNLSAFFAGWAINETFGGLPMQAYNYTLAHPIDAKGNPRGPLWRAYVAAVRSGAPREIIEEAFYRAHIADYKRSTLSPTFRKLYEISPASYRRVVDAYVYTLRSVEAELDNGTKPTVVAKYYPLSVTRELVRRGTMGMVWNAASFRNGLNPWNPLAREWWFSFWGMIGTFVTNRHPKAAKADAIAIDLSAKESRELSQTLGIHLPSGVSTVDKELLSRATFSEPPRGKVTSEPLPRFNLALSDFDRVDPIHAPMPVSGTDGVFQAKELAGVVRQAQARVRSNLIHAFQREYPTPMNGLLEYSANMLALTGSYHQHQAYGMVPNIIMPVDNFGRPKTAKWQAYVDAHHTARRNRGPSKEKIERLWFEAHMEDFEQIDSPAFREQARLFWRDAIKDPALAPLATYFIAMVHGREVYEQAMADKLPYEEALVRSFDHFRETIVGSGAMPFLGEEMRSVTSLLAGKLGQQPKFDERGLPTDRTLTSRMLEGLVNASGIARTLLRGGVLNARDTNGKHIAVNTVADSLLGLADVMSPEQLAKVDPAVMAYYANPTKWRGASKIAMIDSDNKPHGLVDFMGHAVNDAIVRVASHVGGSVIGTDMFDSGCFAFEDELRRDQEGKVHWNRYVVGDDGRRKALFLASFMADKGQLRETFYSSFGLSVPLYFDVTPYQGGVQLTLDRKRSSRLLSTFADVTFRVTPAANGCVKIRGELEHRHLARATSSFEAVMKPPHAVTPKLPAPMRTLSLPKAGPSDIVMLDRPAPPVRGDKLAG